MDSGFWWGCRGGGGLVPEAVVAETTPHRNTCSRDEEALNRGGVDIRNSGKVFYAG